MIRLAPIVAVLAAALGVAQAQTPPGAPPAPMREPAPKIANPQLPSIFIAGDSTAAVMPAPRCGWGVPFAAYFDPAKVNVVNCARGGRSSRTFITEGHWDELMALVKPGDIVLIQFGHNDGGSINRPPPGTREPLRARGSLPGLGDKSQAIDNAVTHKHEIVHTFGWYMRRMIEDVRKKGATPIVLGVTVRDNWRNGKVERGPGRYTEWSYEVAKQEGVGFVNLTSIIADEYEKMGQPAVKALFPLDSTHTGPAGAELNAKGVVGGLRALPGDPIGPWLSDKGAAIAPVQGEPPAAPSQP